MSSHYDVVIIGAGISGINFAHRLKQSNPELTFAIFDSRDSVGGTWDFFKYPGIRSDSDLYTFGFSWYPWTEDRAIADASSIKQYLVRAIKYANLEPCIKLRHKVVKADFSTESATWALDTEVDGQVKPITCRFTIFATGYYDYEKPLQTTIPGLDHFEGKVIHPQFWPEDLDYTDKNIVVIGSGATAITLLPNLAQRAKHVTMLQRSPGYVISMNNRPSPLLKWLLFPLPQTLVYSFMRLWFMTSLFLSYQFCSAFPGLAKRRLRAAFKRELPPDVDVDRHFTPSYNPWGQRLCLSPDGDFFSCLRDGTASVVTGHIRGFHGNSIFLVDGQSQIDDVDIVVTATGLRLVFAGKIQLSVDGHAVDPSTKLLWRGCMLEDLPNACFLMGYTNASWTLGVDASAVLVCRLLSSLSQQKESGRAAAVTPRFPGMPEERALMKTGSYLNLNSTYITKAASVLPKVGDVGPWQPRSNYYLDYCIARWGNLNDGLEFRDDDRADLLDTITTTTAKAKAL